ncbi:hypothetical protein LguiB_012882 [Lonicera macranthoides]
MNDHVFMRLEYPNDYFDAYRRLSFKGTADGGRTASQYASEQPKELSIQRTIITQYRNSVNKCVFLTQNHYGELIITHLTTRIGDL